VVSCHVLGLLTTEAVQAASGPSMAGNRCLVHPLGTAEWGCERISGFSCVGAVASRCGFARGATGGRSTAGRAARVPLGGCRCSQRDIAIKRPDRDVFVTPGVRLTTFVVKGSASGK